MFPQLRRSKLLLFPSKAASDVTNSKQSLIKLRHCISCKSQEALALIGNGARCQIKGIFRQKLGINWYVLLLLNLVLFTTTVANVSAHKVKTAADVGGTLHIEPNDNPRAGEPAKAWFALTRKGGKVIPLAECNCQLAVYAEPHQPGEPALIQPPLKPVVAERYQGIPGAEILFPRPGNYQLQLSGKPAASKSFQPFQLKFAVTVAAGVTTDKPKKEEIETGSSFWQIGFITLSTFAAIGIFVVVLQRVRRS